METFKIIDIVMKGNEHGELRPNTFCNLWFGYKGRRHKQLSYQTWYYFTTFWLLSRNHIHHYKL